jgi:hypothetical protein
MELPAPLPVPGRLHEAAGNGGPREMILPRFAGRQNSAYSPPPIHDRQCALVAQLDRALASGARGHRFESCRAH